MISKEYWEKRMLEQILMGERSVLEYETMLGKSYAAALAEIQKEIQAFYAKYAKNNKITYAEARRLLNAGELKSFQALMTKWYTLARESGLSAEYIAQLQKLGSRVQISRLESLETAVQQQIETLKTHQYKSMLDLLSINYAAAYYDATFNISQGLGFAVNFATIDKNSIETVVKTRWQHRNFSDSIWTDKTKLINVMHTVIPQSFSRGLNSRQLGDMIAREMNTSKNHGRALARTEVNYLSNQADLATYKAIEIEEYSFLATLDPVTTKICRSLDGFIFPVAQATVSVNFPPMHVNCRSTTVPYFADQKVAERVARNQEGETITVSRAMTQESWVKHYVPEDQQEEILQFMQKYKKENLAGVKSIYPQGSYNE